MACISIATTANCHDYKAKPTTSIVANATGSNEEGNGGGDPGVYLRPYGRPKGLLLDRPLLAINLV